MIRRFKRIKRVNRINNRPTESKESKGSKRFTRIFRFKWPGSIENKTNSLSEAIAWTGGGVDILEFVLMQ